ncbi:MAG: GNAT family N-acetyltransferase [Microthrixaceae bacterium]|nr:GNAT family N-acetyltransferase [Microthrixaceae bacterium]
MTVSVRVAECDDDLLEAARIDLTAFGLPFARTPTAIESLERSLQWRRTTTTYLAELEGRAVGTARVYDMALSTPGAMSVPVSGVGDLGVLPGFGGRGVLRALVVRMLDDARARGHVGAALYASEATIYGRFGFGPATRSRRVRIPVARAAMRDDVSIAVGRTEILEPTEWFGVLPELYGRAAARRGGEVSRSSELWANVLCGSSRTPGTRPGEWEATPGADDRFCMVHHDPTGAPVSYGLYSIEESWEPEGPAHSMTVHELVAVDAAAELALWQALLTLSLVRHVDAWVTTDSPLLYALEDRWAPSVSGEHDKLWLRIVDPVKALSMRRYRIAGDVVLSLTDGGPAGEPLTVALSVASGGATGVVVEYDGPGQLTMGVAELAEVLLGGGSVALLASVGRVTEARPGEAARLDAMFGWSPLPYVTHAF